MTSAALERVLARLDGARKTPRGYLARCPAHADHTPSLSLHPGDDRVLLFCHAGCPPGAIVAALGLPLADLYDEPVARRSALPQTVASRSALLPTRARLDHPYRDA